MVGHKFPKSILAIALVSLSSAASAEEGKSLPDNAVYQYESRSAWKSVADSISCSPWVPSDKGILIGETVVQKRSCESQEVQTIVKGYTVRETGESITLTEKRRRPVVFSQQKTAEGTYDPVTSTTMTAWSLWSPDVIDASTCEDVKLDVAEIPLNQHFLSTLWCDADLVRHRYEVKEYHSGKTQKTDVVAETQHLASVWPLFGYRKGQQDAWDDPVAESGTWVDDGEPVCEEWPDELEQKRSEVKWGEQFTFSRQCEREQTRTVSTVRYSLSGQKDIIDSTTEVRVEAFADEETFSGIKDEAVSTAMEPVGIWKTVSQTCKPEDIAEWLPLGQTFLDIQECKVVEAQPIGRVTKYLSGKEDITERSVQNRTFTETFVALREGRKDVLLEENADTRTSDWIDNGAIECSAWAPSIIDVNKGTGFLQIQTCTQPQSRQKESMDKWASGPKWQVSGTERRDVTSYAVQFATGVKQPSDTLFSDTVNLKRDDTIGFASDAITVSKPSQYDRLKVNVTVDGRSDAIGIVITNSDSVYELPIMSKSKQTFYFSAGDNVSFTETWRVRITPNSALTDDISVTLEATLVDIDE